MIADEAAGTGKEGKAREDRGGHQGGSCVCVSQAIAGLPLRNDHHNLQARASASGAGGLDCFNAAAHKANDSSAGVGGRAADTQYPVPSTKHAVLRAGRVAPTFRADTARLRCCRSALSA